MSQIPKLAHRKPNRVSAKYKTVNKLPGPILNTGTYTGLYTIKIVYKQAMNVMVFLKFGYMYSFILNGNVQTSN